MRKHPIDAPAPAAPSASECRNIRGRRVAAMDLGSNSFHLLIAEMDSDGWRPLSAMAEKVQLAAGLETGQLTDAAISRGLDCLGRFACEIHRYDVDGLRAVATQALRCAANAQAFIEPAQQLLGHRVEVISGEMEGELVYRAVARTKPERNLVVDIGGASTELVLGQGPRIDNTASIPIGCINFRRYFPDGAITAEALNTAIAASRDAVWAACGHWNRDGANLIGCSGTLLAVEQVLIALGWSKQGITPSALAQLREALLGQAHLDAVNFPGLSESRRSVFASGLVIVLGLFEVLAAQHMALSPYALREGVIEDLWRRGNPLQRAL